MYGVSISLQEVISAFNENFAFNEHFHISCEEDFGEIQSEEEILEWFNVMLSGGGQWRWERNGQKWQVVKDHLNITSTSYVYNNKFSTIKF